MSTVGTIGWTIVCSCFGRKIVIVYVRCDQLFDLVVGSVVLFDHWYDLVQVTVCPVLENLFEDMVQNVSYWDETADEWCSAKYRIEWISMRVSFTTFLKLIASFRNIGIRVENVWAECFRRIFRKLKRIQIRE